MHGDEEPVFAELLDHLFKNVHPPGRGPYTYAEVAEGITAAAGPDGKGISASALVQLRTGQKKNPSWTTLRGIIDFFGVEPGYFFSPEAQRRAQGEIALTALMRDPEVLQLALRACGLSPASLATITQVIDGARALEGLTPGVPESGIDLSR